MHRKRASSVGSRVADHLGAIGEEGTHDEDSDTETVDSNDTAPHPPRHYLSPLWIHDEKLKNGRIETIPDHEELFWRDLIDKYLYPIDEDTAEKVCGDIARDEMKWVLPPYDLKEKKFVLKN